MYTIYYLNNTAKDVLLSVSLQGDSHVFISSDTENTGIRTLPRIQTGTFIYTEMQRHVDHMTI